MFVTADANLAKVIKLHSIRKLSSSSAQVLFSPILLLSWWGTPPLRRKVPDCSTYDVWFFFFEGGRYCIECCAGIVSRYFLNLYLQFLWPQWLPVWQHFMFHIRWIAVLRFLLFLYHRFSFPWYISWADGEPHYSDSSVRLYHVPYVAWSSMAIYLENNCYFTKIFTMLKNVSYSYTTCK
jgi:hypothetical protein